LSALASDQALQRHAVTKVSGQRAFLAKRLLESGHVGERPATCSAHVTVASDTHDQCHSAGIDNARDDSLDYFSANQLERAENQREVNEIGPKRRSADSSLQTRSA
jgi:hypothetical protein